MLPGKLEPLRESSVLVEGRWTFITGAVMSRAVASKPIRSRLVIDVNSQQIKEMIKSTTYHLGRVDDADY